MCPSPAFQLLKGEGGITVKANVNSRVSPPLTVIVCVAAGVEGEVVMVRVEFFSGGVIESGLKEQVTPEGKPPVDRTIG